MSVTTELEAQAAQEVGASGLVVQGWLAGGHSATFSPAQLPRPVPLVELVGRVRSASSLPVIAGGGIASREQVAKVLEVGAMAVSVGTALLRASQAGTSELHRQALASAEFERTVLTRAFTGRPARALENDFVRRHSDSAPVAYPAVHYLTKPLRQAALAAGDASRLHLWAGAGFRSAKAAAVEEILGDLSP